MAPLHTPNLKPSGPVQAPWGWDLPLDYGGPVLETSQLEAELPQSQSPLQGPGPCFACCQMGHQKSDCSMMECNIRWEVHPTGHTKTARNPSWTVPACFGQWVATVLLDTGSSISMV